MFNLIKRLWNIVIGKGNAAVTGLEAENMEHLLEIEIKKANDELIKAQAGVAQSFGVVASAEDELKTLREQEKTLIVRFKALDQAGNAKSADIALQVQKLKQDIATWEERLKIARAAADRNQKALNLAREKQKQNIADARRNIAEARINKTLAGALETATGLITTTEGSTYEMNRIATMARETNNLQRGRIMASENALDASGLLDTEAETAVLKDDAAAELRASLGLAPKTKPTPSAPAATETPSAEKQGM